jgi:hypothetical protein
MKERQKTPDAPHLAKMFMDNSMGSSARVRPNGIIVYLDDGIVTITDYLRLTVFVSKREPRYAQLAELVEDTLKGEKIPYERDEWDLPNNTQKWTRFRIKD